jgi:dienelactone hydrolase
MPVGKGTARFPLRGTIAYPPTGQQAPVALILHMRGNPCVGGGEQLPCPKGKDSRYDQGMGWLASALAARGYVAVVPDITATRDFRYESVTGPLGWQLGLKSITRLRSKPADLGVPEQVTLSDQTVAVGHSIGGDQAMSVAIHNPAVISAALLLEPAPIVAGLFPGPDNPDAYLYQTEQTEKIPADLPFAVVVGRCDDDAMYLGGQYTGYAAVDPERSAPAQLVVLERGDHIMLNTRADRESSGGWDGCVPSTDASYPEVAAGIRGTLATWAADALDVFLGRQPSDGAAGSRAGLNPAAPTQLAGARAILISPATMRTTALLPQGGALGPQPAPALAADDPLAGATDGVRQAVAGLTQTVCLAGGAVDNNDPAKAPCSRFRVERPGDSPALHLDAGTGSGTWTATLPQPASGAVLATISTDPKSQPKQVTVRAGGATTTLDAATLAVPGKDDELPRSLPIQVRLVAGDPVTDIVVEVTGGAVFMQDVFVVG